MALSSKEYWEKRSLERLTEAEKASIPYIRKVRKVYEASARSIVESVKKMYAAYYSRQENDGTGRFDTLKLNGIVPSGDLKRFLTDMKAAGLSTRLPSYYKGRMTRAKLLEAQMWVEIQKAADQERELSTESYKKTINHSYYRSIYDYSRATSSDQTFSKLNDRAMNRILGSKLAKDDYSNRIWKSSDKLANSVKDIMGRAIATGQPLEKTTKDVMHRFDVKKYEAERLIRTETNSFENYAEIESYEEMDIDRFVFMATLDGRTSEICRSMDGKIFKTKDAKQGENVPPLHPYCRSTIAPYLGKESLPAERRARDPREDGKSQVVKFQSFQSWADENGILGVNEGKKGNRSNIEWRLGSKHYKAVNSIVNKLPKNEQLAFRNFEKQLRIADPLYYGRSHFSPNGGVKVNIAKDAQETRNHTAYRTTMHELGHNLDYLARTNKQFMSFLSKDYGNGTFVDMLRDEYKALLEATKLKTRAKTTAAAENRLRRELMQIKIKDRVFVSDIFSAASTDKVNGGWHHSADYWRGDLNRRATETFTEMFSATATSKEGLAYIKKYFPETYGVYKKIVKEMATTKVKRADIMPVTRNTPKLRDNERLSIETPFKNIKPKAGNVQREGGLQLPKGKEHERSIGEWIVDKVGGKITILDESKKSGVHMPDMLRNKTEIIETKKTSSKSSIDTRVKEAVKQLENKNLLAAGIVGYEKMRKILILDGQDKEKLQTLSSKEISDIVTSRINRAIKDGHDIQIDYVIVKRFGKSPVIIKPEKSSS